MTRRTWVLAAILPCQTVLESRAEEVEPHALLFGTVFRESYLALPGARVVAYEEANPRRKYRTVSNYRGEYRIRVPAGDASFVISASAPRFTEVRRTVQVYGIEKTTANLILEPRKQARSGQRRKAGR